MKTLITYLAILLSVNITMAEKPEVVTKENAITAIREFRAGVKLISDIHMDMMSAAFTRDANDDEIEIPKKHLGAYKRARKHLERSANLNPYFPDVYVFLANSYWEIENDLEKTIEYYSKALEIDPKYDDVISARGYVYVMLKRKEEAEKDLRSLEALKSDHAVPLREEIALLKGKRVEGAKVKEK